MSKTRLKHTETSLSMPSSCLKWIWRPHAKANKMQRRGRLKGNYTQEKMPQYNKRYHSVITRRAIRSMSFYLSVGARAPLGNSNLKSQGRAAVIMDGQPCRHCHIGTQHTKLAVAVVDQQTVRANCQCRSDH